MTKTEQTYAFAFANAEIVLPGGQRVKIEGFEIMKPLIKHDSHGRVVGVMPDYQRPVVITPRYRPP